MYLRTPRVQDHPVQPDQLQAVPVHPVPPGRDGPGQSGRHPQQEEGEGGKDAR